MSHKTSGRRRAQKKEILIKSLEEEFGVKFNVSGDTKVTTYLREEGLPSLADLIERSEQAA